MIYLKVFKTCLKVFFICLLLGYFASSCACATTIDEIISDLKVLGENGVVGEDIYQTISLDSHYNSYSNYIIMVTQGTHGNIPNQYFQPSKLSTTRYLYIVSFTGNEVTNRTNDTRNDLYWFWNFGSNSYGSSFNLNSGQRVLVGSFALGDSIEPFYLYTTAPINTRLIHLGAGEEYGGSYLSKKIDFIPLYDGIVNFSDYSNVYAKKVRQNIVYFGTLNIDTNTYKYFRFKFLDSYGYEVGWLDYNVDNDYYSSSTIDAFLPPLKVYIQRRLIYFQEIYTLVIYASDEPLNNDNTNSSDSLVLTYIFLPPNAVITGNTITNPGSGDSYTIQDSTNDIISNVYNNGSGDSPGIVQQIYDDLFTLKEDDFDNIYSYAANLFPSGDVMAVNEIIFSTLHPSGDDFVIAWDNIPINFSLFGGAWSYSGDFISANSINFSKACRDNEQLGLLRFWINVFMQVSFSLAYIYAIYKCILIVIGVSTELVPETEERKPIGFMQGGYHK